jgi:thiol-disulfide isomerase/thioredoxin
MACRKKFVHFDEPSRYSPHLTLFGVEMTPCNVLIGSVVAVLVYSAMKDDFRHIHHERISGLWSHVTTMASSVSSKLATPAAEPGAPDLQTVEDNSYVKPKIPTPSKNLAIVDAKDAKETPLACQDMSDDERKANATKIKKHLARHPVVVIMFFAKWCGHCTKALPSFNNASLTSKVPYLLVNADAVPRDFLTSKGGGIVDVPHFPFIARIEKGRVAKVMEKPVSDETVKEEVGYDSAESTKATADALQMFF